MKKKELYPLFYCILFALALTNHHPLYPNTFFNSAYLMTGEINLNNTMGYYNSHIWGNAYSIYSLLIAFLIKLNLDIYKIEFITTFSYIFVFVLGFYLISLSITKKRFISLILASLVIFFEIDLDTIDYRTGYFNYSVQGTVANAYFILFLGLLAGKKYFIAGFLAASFYLIHAVVGIFTLGTLIITLLIIFYFNKIHIKKLTYGLLFGFIFLFINLIFKHFFFKNLGISLLGFENIDWDLYKTYLLNWDWHRSHNYFRRLYLLIFILFTLFILFLSIIIIIKKKHRNLYIFNIFIVLSVIEGLILFVIFKKFTFPNENSGLFDLLFAIPIPTRFLNLTSTFIFIIFTSYCIFLTNYYKYFRKYIILFLVLFIPTIIYLKDVKYQTRLKIYNSHLSMKNSYYSISKFEFWNKIKKLENKGSFIVHSNKYNYLFTVLTNKPNFLLFPNIDIVNYFPQYVPFIAMAISDIYEIDFDNPELCKSSGGLQCDSVIQENIASKSKNEWKFISKKYDIQGIILPVNWNINLKPTFKDNGMVYYGLK